ncbi:MAG: hypothetical protein H7831_05715 [Magnetococcus sp. WYHC-3]
MKASHTLLVGALVLSALITGCTRNIPMPWETQNLLDPNRVAVRQPLEIPPDLNVLPGSPEAGKVLNPGESATAPAASSPDDNASSASAILFGSPRPEPVAPLGRDRQERLPHWMEK